MPWDLCGVGPEVTTSQVQTPERCCNSCRFPYERKYEGVTRMSAKACLAIMHRDCSLCSLSLMFMWILSFPTFPLKVTKLNSKTELHNHTRVDVIEIQDVMGDNAGGGLYICADLGVATLLSQYCYPALWAWWRGTLSVCSHRPALPCPCTGNSLLAPPSSSTPTPGWSPLARKSAVLCTNLS